MTYVQHFTDEELEDLIALADPTLPLTARVNRAAMAARAERANRRGPRRGIGFARDPWTVRKAAR